MHSKGFDCSTVLLPCWWTLSSCRWGCPCIECLCCFKMNIMDSTLAPAGRILLKNIEQWPLCNLNYCLFRLILLLKGYNLISQDETFRFRFSFELWNRRVCWSSTVCFFFFSLLLVSELQHCISGGVMCHVHVGIFFLFSTPVFLSLSAWFQYQTHFCDN